jgi:FkbM family methyltransferase
VADDTITEEQLAAKLAALERELALVRAERDFRATQVEALQQKIAGREERYRRVISRTEGLAAEIYRIQRFILGEQPLRHRLAKRRAGTTPASLLDERARREARFSAACAAYREIVAGDRFTQVPMAPVQIDGLTWWYPRHERDRPNRADQIAAQGLHLGGILQARELAVGGVMLDIGANIGRVSIPRAILGDVQAIYAAEAEPANYACLVRNVIDNGVRGAVLPDQVAIGSRDGEVELDCPITFTSPHVRYSPTSDPPRRERITVPCRTLDTWIDAIGIDPLAVSYVKVDTNGYELDVLRGAPRLLALRSAAWQMEVAPECLKDFGIDMAAFCAEAAAHFTHFVDLSNHAQGGRYRPVAEMPAALQYLIDAPAGGKAPVTDLLFYAAD